MTKKWTDRADAQETKKPKLLLVDDMGIMLPKLAERLEAQGFEVVKMHIGNDAPIDDSTIVQGSFDKTVEYAVAPTNRIDAVVTDLNNRDYPYGRYLVADLVKHGFNGPIAVHSGEVDSTMDKIVKEKGAVGLFDKREPEAIANAINTALAERGQAKG